MNEQELKEIEARAKKRYSVFALLTMKLVAEMRRLNGELAMAMDAVDELSRQMAEIERLAEENARLRAALHMIEGAVLPVQTELGMVAVEDVQELIDIAADALKGGEG